MTDIAVCLDLDDTRRQRLLAGAADWPVTFLDPAAPCRATIVFGNPSPDRVAANAGLRWLQLESVGFGEYSRLDWARGKNNAMVTNLAGFFADPVAETALAGILALIRGIDRLGVLRAKSEWVGDPIRTELRLLTGARVVLFGRGAINGRLAELLEPFRCKVTVFGHDWMPGELNRALAGADVVVATVPHAAGTEGLFDAARIGRIRHGAIFANLGRGSLVDEAALAAALVSRRLAGAVIDVTRDEPLPSGHPFWNAPNTILTQHTGGGTADEIDRKIDWFLANLDRYRAGDPLRGSVDFAKGY